MRKLKMINYKQIIYKMNQTLGQERVGCKIEHSNDYEDIIKQKSADTIDLLESMRPVGSHAIIDSKEVQRSISLAQTEIEIATMCAVRAVFKAKDYIKQD